MHRTNLGEEVTQELWSQLIHGLKNHCLRFTRRQFVNGLPSQPLDKRLLSYLHGIEVFATDCFQLIILLPEGGGWQKVPASKII